MACHICGRADVLHGSDHHPGAEYGCHDGVWMDDDVHAEGWHDDVSYPPCPNNPLKCSRCDGSGIAPADVEDRDDCPACQGTGWKNGDCQYPSRFDPDEEAFEATEAQPS